MSPEKWYHKLEHLLPWGFIGVVLAVVFAFYTFREKKPLVEYKVLNEANVLDLHKPLSDLKILFKGEDIQEKKLNLKIYTIRIENVGETDILEGHYDSKKPWGIAVSDGALIEVPRVVDVNSEYLRENISPTVVTNDFVAFNKVIFERGKYFTIEALILHRKDAVPVLSVVGKIAGIEHQQIVLTEKKEVSFWERAFYAAWPIQLARGLAYTFCVIAILGIIIAVSVKIESWRTRVRKEKAGNTLAPFSETLDEDSKSVVKNIINYTDGRLAQLKELRDRLSKPETLTPILRSRRMITKSDSESGNFIVPDPVPSGFIVERGDGSAELNPNAVRVLNAMISFLEQQTKKPSQESLPIP